VQLGLGLQSLVSRYITFGPEIRKLKKNWAKPRAMARVARGVHPPLLPLQKVMHGDVKPGPVKSQITTTINVK